MKSTLYFVSGVRPSKLKELMEWNDKRQGQLHLFFSLFFQRQEKRRKVELLWLMAQQTQIKENFFSLIVCGARGGQLSSINLINESKDICFIDGGVGVGLLLRPLLFHESIDVVWLRSLSLAEPMAASRP